MKVREGLNEAIPKARRNGSGEAIVAAAERLFLERGFGSVSMDDLAAAAGVARRTLYNQFASKEEIFREMLLQGVGSARDRISARHWPLLPGEKETYIAWHPTRVVQDLSPEMESERPKVIAPEFIAGARTALQSLVPVGLRIVDPSPTISAEAVRKAVNLNFAVSAFCCPVYQLHNELHQLFGCPVRRLVKLLHHCLLLFLLLLQPAHLLSGFGRFALGHSTPQIGSGERSGVAIFGHNVSLRLCNVRSASSCNRSDFFAPTRLFGARCPSRSCKPS
jgi:AcrR family transcriptional regulator